MLAIDVYLVTNKTVRPSQTETAFLEVLHALVANTSESYIENA